MRDDKNNEATAAASRLQAVAALGQQIWLDNLSRGLLQSGELARWIGADGITGVTSNPAIFYNAIRNDPAYRAELPGLQAAYPDLETRFEHLVLPDIQGACGLLSAVYQESQGKAGFVSFEVSPRLAHDAAGTVAAARRLWRQIARPNAMIKIPATDAGIQALEEVIADGINVNVTLIFSAGQLAKVQAAYQRGLQRRVDAGLPVAHLASVASVFISRIDVVVDQQLAKMAGELQALSGKAAISAAKLAYRNWQQDLAGGFASLAQAGARPQWLLWASTGTKNPALRDVLYVEQLIGKDTVNTVPDATLAAFRDHGEASETLAAGVDAAQQVLNQLSDNGILLEQIGSDLLQAGLKQFEDAYTNLLALLE
ncbi:transaldolase [Undibacterium sp.]|jgi:transaldolase|uniref:transaldolase n=1 Tax=Undibacterium sp. TaxID=1914977 RepID=UPI002CFB77CF|nr:transaldolase [Undibacterium sp.]HTD02840.1 transaldolase [Undibacterium sp.]